MKDIKWIPIIPLIGGFPLGAEKALGKNPQFIASYDGFLANDSHYIHYKNQVQKANLEYRIISTDLPSEKVNIVVGTPPLKLAA